MPPRKPAPVSLSPVRDRREIAEAALRKFGLQGAKRSDGPTPERLLQAGGAARVERFADTTAIVDGSRTGEVEIEAVRVRLADSPFEALCARRLIDRRPARNLTLCTAGVRYRQAWHDTGNVGLRSIDFGRVGVSTGGGLFASERAAQAFKLMTKIEHAMETLQTQVARAIILHDRPVLDIGREVSGFRAEAQATGVATMLLRNGLASAARVLGIATAIGDDDETE